MRIRNKEDFWSGVMFLATGLGFAFFARQYTMGSAADMGPGYFPFWLSIVLIALGLVISGRALNVRAEETRIEGFDWKVVLMIVGSVVLTGGALGFLGIYVTVFLLVLLSSMASHAFSWKVATITGIFMALFAWLAFVKGLGLIFPPWPSFTGS